tara:strand:- start:1004 stop:1759 length:756 start_codon:yes stop_codon:yes gene_type:complete
MNKLKYVLLAMIIASSTTKVWSQKKIVDTSFDTWWSNINKFNLNENWYLTSELHFRRANGINDWQQFILRPALNYKLNADVHLALGYSFIKNYPYGSQPIAIMTPENNVWEQVTLKHKTGKLSLSHRYRFEQRFIGKTVYNSTDFKPVIDGTSYAHRFRYRLTMTLPLIESGKVFMSGFNEVWINLDDKSVMPTSLNQNWAYVGFGYKFNSQGKLQLGYMNQLIKKGDGIHYENNHTLQFTIAYEFFKSVK